MTVIGDFIKERRNIKNLSKRALAEIAGISHTEVHRIENGDRENPSVKILSALAEPLSVTKEEMLRAAGYLTSDDNHISPIQKAFPDLRTDKEQKTVQKIVDGLARNSDLNDDDYDDLVDQVEMFLNHAKKKKKKNTK